MIRYAFITLLLLLAAFVVQQFLPAFTGLYNSRILLMQLVFLCAAVTVDQPAMLLLAFVGGFLWDAQSTLGPHGGDPSVYNQPVDSLRFGYSIVLFAGIGFLMHGVQPWFRAGKWQFSIPLSGIAVFLYLAAEYFLICFVRGEFFVTRATLLQVGMTSLLTMAFAPVVFWLLFNLASWCGYPLRPVTNKQRRSSY